MITNLEQLRWNDYFDGHFTDYRKKGLIPARVSREQKQQYCIMGEFGEVDAILAGRYIHRVETRKDYPATGDWVAIQPVPGERKAVIHSMLPRKSALVRKTPVSGGRKMQFVAGQRVVAGGLTEEQVIASNLDYLFFITDLKYNFNLRRIERFLTLSHESGAEPVVILNKLDLMNNWQEKLTTVEDIAPGLRVVAISALKSLNIDKILHYMQKGNTVAVFGSSGVGKSTLINRLLGKDLLATGVVRNHDGKGKHTTTWREMVVLPNGGIIIDTPGIRELQLWTGMDSVSEIFDDIEQLMSQCRFRNCRHKTEPGCAVRRAIKTGDLQLGRYENYISMKSEVTYLSSRREEKKVLLSNKRHRKPYTRKNFKNTY